jgi:hypothetical protein
MSYFVTIHLLIPFGIGYWLRNMNETKQKSWVINGHKISNLNMSSY